MFAFSECDDVWNNMKGTYIYIYCHLKPFNYTTCVYERLMFFQNLSVNKFILFKSIVLI